MTPINVTAVSAPAPPPPLMRAFGWLRANFFADAFSVALTIGLAALAIWIVPRLVDWAVLHAVWLAEDPSLCRQAGGACWAVIGEKHRVILFGTYPYDEQWRGALVILIVLGLTIVSTWRRLWSPALLAAWLLGLMAALAFQFGGVFGLSYIGTERWGGLPLTVLLFVGTIAGGFPLAILLALGRRSHLPAIRALSTGYIETVRGVPLVNVLFMAALMFPLFMPEGVNLNKLLRAQIGLILFFAAYAAEVVRGGLQAVPHGQHEAADALGITYWDKTLRIVLPQALRIVLPALVNDVIRAFKNTSLLAIIGLFDILGGTMAALEDPNWTRYYLEAYLFIAALYFSFCFPLSQYSQRLERVMDQGRNY
jgi:general L-amino acid transport system permease protein